ncbi:MAG: ion transporter [archaeon]
MKQFSKKILALKSFEYVILSFIILQAVALIIETLPVIPEWMQAVIPYVHWVVIIAFTLEALLKIVVLSPKTYLKQAWNVFDAFIVIISYLPFGIIIPLAKALRVVRVVGMVHELKSLVEHFLSAYRHVLEVLLLLLILLFGYALLGFHYFAGIDPDHWNTLGLSFLSLLQVMTLDNWGGIMQVAMTGAPYAWIFFVSFIFCVAILFIVLVVALVKSVEKLRT